MSDSSPISRRTTTISLSSWTTKDSDLRRALLPGERVHKPLLKRKQPALGSDGCSLCSIVPKVGCSTLAHLLCLPRHVAPCFRPGRVRSHFCCVLWGAHALSSLACDNVLYNTPNKALGQPLQHLTPCSALELYPPPRLCQWSRMGMISERRQPVPCPRFCTAFAVSHDSLGRPSLCERG